MECSEKFDANFVLSENHQNAHGNVYAFFIAASIHARVLCKLLLPWISAFQCDSLIRPWSHYYVTFVSLCNVGISHVSVSLYFLRTCGPCMLLLHEFDERSRAISTSFHREANANEFRVILQRFVWDFCMALFEYFSFWGDYKSSAQRITKTVKRDSMRCVICLQFSLVSDSHRLLSVLYQSAIFEYDFQSLRFTPELRRGKELLLNIVSFELVWQQTFLYCGSIRTVTQKESVVKPI